MTQKVDYIDLYTKLYSHGYQESPDISCGKHFCAWIAANLDNKFKSMIDVGCGNGWALRYFKDRKKQVTGADVSTIGVDRLRRQQLTVAHCSAHELGKVWHKEFDLYLSTDCFEHLHPDHVNRAIISAFHITKKYLALKICPRVDVSKRWKGKIIDHDLHLTVKPVEWWREQFLQHGGTLIYAEGECFIIDIS